MATKLEEITAVYSGQVFLSDDGDYVIGRARPVIDGQTSFSEIAVLGNLNGDELAIGTEYRFYGRKEMGAGRYAGKQQFRFQTFIKPTPAGREGVTRYLAEAPGIGRSYAQQLWQKFGPNAVRILREQPDVAAAAVPRLTTEQAAAAAKFLASQQKLEAATVDLIDLLGGRGLPRTLAKACIEKWGNKAAAMVRHNPYLLMAFRGCGFLRTDALYLDLGHNAARMKRQALCVWHSIASRSDGHTWFGLDEIQRGLQGKISGVEIDGPRACLLAKRAGMVATRRDADGNLWFAEGAKAKAEAYVARRVAGWIEDDRDKGPKHWTTIDGRFDSLSDHQREKLTAAISGTIGSLGGAPGTGKTFTAARLISTLIEDHGIDSVAIAAPTGKASVRITEVMQSYGVQVRAKTIHSTLGVQQVEDRGGWSFKHNEYDPLPYKFVVVDECSMLCSSLMASLLAAIGKGTRILLTGDVNQLPPVGHGAPLRDLIAAGIPYGELREIRRNSGRIVQACSEIRDGKRFRDSEAIDIDAGENLKVVEAATAPQQIERMLAAIQVAGQQGFDPVWDVQVIVPVNAKSPLARKTLNQRLQSVLNPNGQQAKGSPFRVGDKVVCLKNGWFPLADGDDCESDDSDNESCRDADEPQTNDDGKVFVANGEIGKVMAVAEKKTIVRLDGPRRLVLVPRGAGKGDSDESSSDGSGGDSENAGTGCNWDMAYAVSAHKSQGAEFPIAIVMIDGYPGASMVCDRAWTYTAISRAKKLCLLIGKKATADQFCRQSKLEKRKTFLVELIDENRKRIQAVGSAASAATNGGTVEETESAEAEIEAIGV